MKIIYGIDEIKKFLRSENKSIGFVATMGALHKGHLKLVEKSIMENDLTVVSIFVNPTQFNNPEDLKSYPNHLDNDISQLSEIGVDFLFLPEYKSIYNDNYIYRIVESNISKTLCGSKREGHFEGVLTVVMKLLNIVSPTRAYFGEKDYQQFLLIKNMVKAFHLDTEIIPVSTVREQDGLACSSRNLLLNENDRLKASKFYQLLMSENTDNKVIDRLMEEGFEVDYIETVDGRRYGAVFLGKVRLIDNVEK